MIETHDSMRGVQPRRGGLAGRGLSGEFARPARTGRPLRFLCSRHQQTFVDLLTREGCCDAELMERSGRRLLAWLSQKFPWLVLQQFNAEGCLGCALEDAHMEAEAEQAVHEVTSSVLAEARR